MIILLGEVPFYEAFIIFSIIIFVVLIAFRRYFIFFALSVSVSVPVCVFVFVSPVVKKRETKRGINAINTDYSINRPRSACRRRSTLLGVIRFGIWLKNTNGRCHSGHATH